jgi:hypothetical protein
MIRVFSNLFTRKTPFKLFNNQAIQSKTNYQFASFVDKMTKKQSDKTEEEIKKEI